MSSGKYRVLLAQLATLPPGSVCLVNGQRWVKPSTLDGLSIGITAEEFERTFSAAFGEYGMLSGTSVGFYPRSAPMERYRPTSFRPDLRAYLERLERLERRRRR